LFVCYLLDGINKLIFNYSKVKISSSIIKRKQLAFYIIN
jgi:hypothetical protein